MPETIPHATLKAKQRALRVDFPETMGLRVHRSISWIGRAEQAGDDHDAAFLFLWIAFNAAYADEGSLQGIATGERGAFEGFFAKLVALDADQQIYNAIWQRFSGPIRNLMQNRYVFNPFWQFHNGVDGYDDWEVKRSCKIGQSVKVYSNAKKEYQNDETTEVFRPVQGQGCA